MSCVSVDSCAEEIKSDGLVLWEHTEELVPYQESIFRMEKRVEEIFSGEKNECVWLLEHPPLYTAGTSAQPKDLIDSGRFPVFQTGRGGQYTYHGPGQRIGYVMLDLRRRGKDVGAFVSALERWLILALKEFGIKGERRSGRVGVWVVCKHEGHLIERKIAALGVRVRKWITYHGVSLNVSPDLSHFSGIIPCGLAEYGVTSLQELGVEVSQKEVDHVLIRTFSTVFGQEIDRIY